MFNGIPVLIILLRAMIGTGGISRVGSVRSGVGGIVTTSSELRSSH